MINNNLKLELEKIIIKSKSGEKQLLCDLSFLENKLFKEIHNILFLDDINEVAYLGKIIVDMSDDLKLKDKLKEVHSKIDFELLDDRIREKIFWEFMDGSLKNFFKEIYDLRGFVKNILPKYFPLYKIEKIYIRESPDFSVKFTNNEEFGIECCNLLTTELYEQLDNNLKLNIVNHSNYETIYLQLKIFEKHLKNNPNGTKYLFNFGGSARFIFKEIENIADLIKICDKYNVDTSDVFLHVGTTKDYKKLNSNWIKLSEIKYFKITT